MLFVFINVYRCLSRFPYHTMLLNLYFSVYCFVGRRVWRYQRGNQNPYIEEEQTTQWSKEKVQKDKQRSKKHIYKTKDRVTRTPLKTGGELRCSGRVSSSCSTSRSLFVFFACHAFFYLRLMMTNLVSSNFFY